MKPHCLLIALYGAFAIGCAVRQSRPNSENDPANPGAQEAKATPAFSALTMEPSFPPSASAAAPPMQEPMNMPLQMDGGSTQTHPQSAPMNMHGSMKMQHHPAASGAADGGAP